MKNEKNLSMIRGDTKYVTVKICGLDQALDSVFFSCKENPDDENYIFQLSLNDHITPVEGTIDTYRIRITPENTQNIPPKTYYYDLQIGINGDIYTIMFGKLKVLPDITRED